MIEPLGDRFLVKIKKTEEKSKSGIILANTNTDKVQYAKVIEISKDLKIEEEINKGDIIIIEKYNGTEINYELEDFLFINKEDILRQDRRVNKIF